jgi:hypothetical protein
VTDTSVQKLGVVGALVVSTFVLLAMEGCYEAHEETLRQKTAAELTRVQALIAEGYTLGQIDCLLRPPTTHRLSTEEERRADYCRDVMKVRPTKENK